MRPMNYTMNMEEINRAIVEYWTRRGYKVTGGELRPGHGVFRETEAFVKLIPLKESNK